MFVVEALFPFSSVVMEQQKQQKLQNTGNQQNSSKQRQTVQTSGNKKGQAQQEISAKSNPHGQKNKSNQGNTQKSQHHESQQKNNNNGDSSQITYLGFQKGEKILVTQAYENGWWYGHTLRQPDNKGYFPSNYVQVVGQQKQKPKPPPPPPEQQQSQQENEQQQMHAYDPDDENNVDWVKNQLKNITQGPVQSAYYLGIKGYKNVKIDDKNSNILKGDHVKYDVSTGLAKVPVKDQAPAAKAVRQMGYYFDYHQWCEQRNKIPGQKARPDPKRKKIKKLNLKGMK